MNKPKLYNVATGIPAPLVSQVAEMKLGLRWSNHARREAVNDRYGVLPKEAYVQSFDIADGWQLVEVEANHLNHVQKIVVRRAADAKRDIVLVILRDGPFTGIVKTCWTNLNTNTHKTLDRSKLATA